MKASRTKYTFEQLTEFSNERLEDLVRIGSTPRIDDVVGYEYRGFNLQPATKIIGTRKFKKGFYAAYPGANHAWGYNMPIVQNLKDEPWVAVPNEENPRRYFFFKILPAGAPGYDRRYAHTLIVDYSKWDGYFLLNPARYTVDYLVYPDPENRDLMVGRSDFVMGPIRFFMGYFILERHNQSNFVPPKKGSYLSRREMRTVEKFSEVFIDGKRAISPAEIAENVDRQLSRIESKRKGGVKLVLFLIEYVLPLLSLHRPFSRMTPAARKNFMTQNLVHTDFRGRGLKRLILSFKRWYNALRSRTLRDLSRVKTLFLAGYYGDPRVYNSVRFVAVAERKRFQPAAAGKLKTLGLPRLPVYHPAEEELETEVCVIGSGAGGAVVAYNAAAAGKNVVLLEEGKYFSAADMVHHEGTMVAKTYRDGGLQTTVDLDMSIIQGKCLGGTTVINNAICFRLNDADLYEIQKPDIYDRWRELGANIDAKKLEASFDRVEKMINVERVSKKITSRNADVLLDGWERLVKKGAGNKAYKHGLFRKNYKDCLGCGYCNFGCPYERKMSMLETYIPAAIQHGARVIAECHAERIVTQGGRVIGVKCKLPDGRRLFVRAKKVVIACGAIASSVLLLNSGIRRNVGQRFSFNAACLMLARFGEAINGFDGIQMPGYVDTGEAMLEAWFAPPMAFAGIVPGWFDTHFERMANYHHFACAGALIGTENNARVKRTAFLRDLFGPVAYEMTSHDLEKLKRGMVLMTKIYFAYGAEAVYPSTFVDLEMRPSEFDSEAAISDFINDNIRKPDDMILNSSHPQGGNAMSDDPSLGVVDSRFKVHGCNNLFVCDASVFPTTIRINPQLTIMAMADYASHLSIV
jgi:choline dehydrogenase-like flavoprotein